MSTQFKPLEIPGGVVAKATKKMRSSNWSEVNLVRWREGQMSPMGGQAPYTYIFASRCKVIHSWYGLDGVHRIAYLCEGNLYVDAGGTLLDITPSGGMTAPSYGTGGYGDLTYGMDGNYGDPRTLTSSVVLDRLPDVFSLDNFGGILLAMTSPDGKLLQWDPASPPGTLATAVVADSGRGVVPTGRCFVVTPERFVQIFGAYDPTNGGGFRRFAWCDQENFKAWDYPNVTSQAGFLDIEPASPIVTAISTRNGTLFWTSKTTYRSRFLGLPYIYNYEELGDNCTPWSPHSMVNTSVMLLWFSEQGAFSFNGTSILPVACMVRPWVDEDIDLAAVREQACAVHVESFNEFWWFFPQNGQPYNTRCIIYCYKEGWWSQGQMARSAGVTASYSSNTIMADGWVAYQHEMAGFPYYNNADLPWAETFDINISSGSRLTTVKQLMPDIEGDINPTSIIRCSTGNSRSLGSAGTADDASTCAEQRLCRFPHYRP